MIKTKLKNSHSIKSLNLPLYLISFLIILGSCEFEPSDTTFTDVEIPNAPEASLHLPFDKDTVYITGNTYVNFKFECPGYKIYKTSFTIDSEEIYSTSGESVIDNSVSFNYRIINEGTYTLSVTSQVESKSGSIADIIGTESFTYKKSWILVYRYSPEMPKITFVGVVDGQLKIMWDKSKAYNFDSYVINRRYEFHDNYIMQELITDPDEAYFIDTTYIAGKVTYEIGVKEGLYTTTEKIVYEGEIPELKVESNDNLECVFSWSQPECYKNFKSVKVTYTTNNYPYSDYETTLFEVNELAQTSYTILDGPFKNRTYYLYMYPKDPGFGYHIVSTFHSGAGEYFYENSILRITAVPPYYLYGGDGRYMSEQRPFRYNTSTGEYIELGNDIGSDLTVSLNNQYITNGSYRVDPSNFTRTYVDILDDLGTHPPRGRYISNNGIVLASVGTEMHYVDLNKETLHKEFFDSYRNKIISPNGAYIAFTKLDDGGFEIWKYDEITGKYIFQFVHEGNYSHIVFKHSDTESTFYIVNGSTVELWSCENSSLLESHPFQANRIHQIDPVTQNVICNDEDKIYIYSSDQFKLIKEVAIDDNQNFAVVNSVIYKNGKKLDLKKYE